MEVLVSILIVETQALPIMDAIQEAVKAWRAEHRASE